MMADIGHVFVFFIHRGYGDLWCDLFSCPTFSLLMLKIGNAFLFDTETFNLFRRLVCHQADIQKPAYLQNRTVKWGDLAK